MLGILQALCLLSHNCDFKAPVRPPEYIHVCDRNWTKKSLETKLELSIGCSKVNGKYSYNTGKLEEVYGE